MLSSVGFSSQATNFARSLATASLVDNSSNSISIDMSKCINCQSCVKACTVVAGQNVLKAKTVNGKPIIVTKTEAPLSETNCIGCGQCTLVCPVGAIVEHSHIKEANKVLKNKNGKVCVAQIAPAVRINISESFGLPAGTVTTGKVVTALRMLGFDFVFDTNFGADLTIVEEATELAQQLNDPHHKMPMFSSCCPAWINYVQKSAPELIPQISSCRSPMSMLSNVIKSEFAQIKGIDPTNIVNIAIMPCTAKKDEIERPQLSTKDGKKATDIVITTRELVKMIKSAKIDFKALEDSPFDDLYSASTGGASLFCAPGGVMEAAVRSAFQFLTGTRLQPIEFLPVRGKEGIKVGDLDAGSSKIRVATVQGIANAMKLIEKVKNNDEDVKGVKFVEVMACPGGCVCGGGSPKAKTKKATDQRLEATYNLDKNASLRVSQDNPAIQQLYKRFLGKYGSHLAHDLLHTEYKATK